MKLTEEQKQELILDYKNGMTWNSLCKKYQTNTNTIYMIFHKNNISNTRIQNSSWSAEKQNLFKKMYLSNCTYNEMYKALNCKGGTLTYWVHKLNLPMRGSGRNNTLENKFIERTPESDYWLGYIFADGHINCSNRQYIIQLASEKSYVISKFKKWYDSNKVHENSWEYTLKDGSTKRMYTASINSKSITSWFHNNLNIAAKKHHNLNPNISITWDIIRGYFDGDGSASKGEWQLKSCSKVWLERIQRFLLQYNIESKLKQSYLDCWGLYIYDKENLKKIVPLMYKNKYYCHEYKYKLLEPYDSNVIVQTE